MRGADGRRLRFNLEGRRAVGSTIMIPKRNEGKEARERDLVVEKHQIHIGHAGRSRTCIKTQRSEANSFICICRIPFVDPSSYNYIRK